MATTIAVFNQAGGVGKTTLVHNLGYLLHQASAKVLMVDLDSQASLTTFVGMEEPESNIASSLIEKRPLPICSLDSDLDIIPSSRQLHVAEMQLVGEMARELRLKRLLEPVQSRYDFILIDCPPSLTLLPILGLTAADWLLVPIQTHSKAFWGTDQLLATLDEVQESTNPNLMLAGVVPTLYEKRNRQDNKVLDAIRKQLGQITTICSPIPRSTAFPESSQAHLPLIQFDNTHRAVRPLLSLTQQVLEWSSVEQASLVVVNG